MPQKKTKDGATTDATATSSPGDALKSQPVTQLTSGSSRAITITELNDLITTITTNFSLTFNSCFDKLVESLDKKLSTRLDIHEVQSFDLNKRIDKLEKTCTDLHLENKLLQTQVAESNKVIESLMRSMDDMEQYSRGSNLLIHGLQLPADNSPETDLFDKSITMLNLNLKLGITSDDVVTAHRLPVSSRSMTASSPSPSAATVSTRPPPVIIQFASKRTRNQVLSKRRELKGKGMVLTEHLTVSKSNLLRKANDLVISKKIQAAWSSDGKILIKTLQNRTVVISLISDLAGY